MLVILGVDRRGSLDGLVRVDAPFAEGEEDTALSMWLLDIGLSTSEYEKE